MSLAWTSWTSRTPNADQAGSLTVTDDIAVPGGSTAREH
jgi:hypothetical protein